MLQSLTSLCALRDSEYDFLSDLKQLEVLELGDCLNWTSQVCTQFHILLDMAQQIMHSLQLGE